MNGLGWLHNYYIQKKTAYEPLGHLGFTIDINYYKYNNTKLNIIKYINYRFI
jgi:hypothetical protein